MRRRRGGPVAGALLGAALLGAALPGRDAAAQAAEPTRRVRSNANAWLMYFGDHALSPRLGLHLEAQLRRADVVSDPQQLLLRGGVTRYLAPAVSATAGYAYVRTSPYGKFPAAAPFPEHRAWQQLQVAHATGPLAWQHRYRLEQRWVGRTDADGAVTSWRYGNRFRYLARLTLPTRGRTVDPRELYLSAYDELFVNFGRQVELNVFDQNRAYAALGYRLTRTARLEAGYLNQRVYRANGRDVENNHTLQLALFSSAPLRGRR